MEREKAEFEAGELGSRGLVGLAEAAVLCAAGERRELVVEALREAKDEGVCRMSKLSKLFMNGGARSSFERVRSWTI